MIDTSVSRRLHRCLPFALAAILLTSYTEIEAAVIPWGVRVDVDAGAANDPEQGSISETNGAQRGDAAATVTQEGITDGHNFAFSLAAANMRLEILRVRADTVNEAAASASAHFQDTLNITSDRGDQNIFVVFVISGSISGDPSQNNAHFSSSPNPTTVRSGEALETHPPAPGQVRLLGNAVVEVGYHIDTAGTTAVPLAVTLNAFSFVGGRVNFSETAIAYLELPEGVTFVGSDSGLAFADRTDFIIRPGDPIPGTAPVPEPSSVVLGGTGLLALAVTLLRGSRCRKVRGVG